MTGRSPAVEVITDPQDALRVAPDWERLVVATDRPGCGPGWLLPWYRHIGAAQGELHIVVVRDGGRMVGLLPAWTTGRPGALTLRLLGVGLTHRLSVLAAPEDRERVAGAIAEHIARREDIAAVRLEGLSDGDRLPDDLRRGWPRRRPVALREVLMPAPVLALSPDGYEGWLATRSKSMRKTVRQQARRLEELGGTVGPAAEHETEEVVDALCRLHQAHWNARGMPGAIDEATRAMLHEATAALVPRRRIWLFALRIGTEIHAADLVIWAGRRLQAVMGGYAPVERISPGLLSMDAIVRAAHEGGATHIDLGGGDDEYKHRFGAVDDPLAWWTVLPPGRRMVRGLRGHGLRLAEVRAREIARGRLSAERVQRLKAVRARLPGGP